MWGVHSPVCIGFGPFCRLERPLPASDFVLADAVRDMAGHAGDYDLLDAGADFVQDVVEDLLVPQVFSG